MKKKSKKRKISPELLKKFKANHEPFKKAVLEALQKAADDAAARSHTNPTKRK